ncbi:MAG: NTP transferase domain-containing protein [Acidobacteria bacterium]|nr:NTP transferase domain-containing protein [Acidobacteriota bacterium]
MSSERRASWRDPAAPLWAVVLAGGAGRRLAAVTGGVPKQFWCARSGPTLLGQTLDRVAALTPSARTVTVVDEAHRRYLHVHRDLAGLGLIAYQPADRGTAAGVLLGLLTVVEHAPHACVLLTPSDHGVGDVRQFRLGVRDAVERIRSGESRIVLFGAEAWSADAGYGWITRVEGTPGRPTLCRVAPVATFVEKPQSAEAERLLALGAVWNTMVLVARADALLGLYRQHLPDLHERLSGAFSAPVEERSQVVASEYAGMVRADFSRDVIAPASGLDVYTWPASMGWSDLGTPERLEEWCRREIAIRDQVSTGPGNVVGHAGTHI